MTLTRTWRNAICDAKRCSIIRQAASPTASESWQEMNEMPRASKQANSPRRRSVRSGWIDPHVPVTYQNGLKVTFPASWFSTPYTRFARIDGAMLGPGLRTSLFVLADEARCDPDRLLGQMVVVQGKQKLELCIVFQAGQAGEYRLISLCGDRDVRLIHASAEGIILGSVAAAQIDLSSLVAA